jgi:hypothetical protein
VLASDDDSRAVISEQHNSSSSLLPYCTDDEGFLCPEGPSRVDLFEAGAGGEVFFAGVDDGAVLDLADGCCCFPFAAAVVSGVVSGTTPGCFSDFLYLASSVRN